jgi:organic radical activating enzyme
LSELVKILPGENKYLNVTWQVNNWCNYKCSYCNEGNWSGTHKNEDTDKYIDFLDKLITRFQFKGYESFKFFFSGGEPVYWKPLLEVAEFIHKKCDKPLLAINTNLSNSLSWWEKNYHYFQDVVASYHLLLEARSASNVEENVTYACPFSTFTLVGWFTPAIRNRALRKSVMIWLVSNLTTILLAYGLVEETEDPLEDREVVGSVYGAGGLEIVMLGEFVHAL